MTEPLRKETGLGVVIGDSLRRTKDTTGCRHGTTRNETLHGLVGVTEGGPTGPDLRVEEGTSD